MIVNKIENDQSVGSLIERFHMSQNKACKKEERMPRVRKILLWVSVGFLSFSLIAPWAFAKGKGQGQDRSSPSGWSQGEKKGWETDAPAGFEKKDQDTSPSGLNKGQKVQEGKEEGEKLQEKEQKRSREKERHMEKNWEGKSQEK